MRHLSTETLARLVDERAGPEEKEHLETCAACAAELEALRDQTEALASLPDLRPPTDEWDDVRARLIREGLVRPDASPHETDGAGRLLPGGAGWLQAAAALLLFLGGAGVGAGVTGGPGPDAGRSVDADGGTVLASVESVDEAAEELQEAEERYMSALIRYRELAGTGEDDGEVRDPASRYAALEGLLAASQAAIRRAPTDPFLNGVLVSTLAERQATLQEFSTAAADNWF